MLRVLKDIPLKECKAVIFDFDGTLADTMPTIVKTARRVLLDVGLKEDELGDLTRLVGPPFPQAFSWIYGMSPEEAMDVTERYRVLYNHLGLDAWPAFIGIADMLLRLKDQGKQLAVASSKKHSLVNKAIADNGFDSVFDVVCGKLNDVNYSKADAILAALAALGVTASEAVMVGDRNHDALAAAEVGVPCVGVLWGNTGTPEELEDAGCVALVDTVDEFIELLGA